MVTLFKHKDLEDYFVEVDYSTRDPQTLASVVELYERGRCIVLRNAKIDHDAAFLSGITLDGEVFKKFKSVRFVSEYFDKGVVPPDLLAALDGDKGRLRHFAEQVRDVNSQMNA